VDYGVDHHPGNSTGDAGWFLISIRDAARPNSELLVAPVSNPAATRVLLPHRADVQIDRSGATAKYIIINERSNASTRVVVHSLAGGGMPAGRLGAGKVITFDEAVYDLSGGGCALVDCACATIDGLGDFRALACAASRRHRPASARVLLSTAARQPQNSESNPQASPATLSQTCCACCTTA
jgi:hypothetical protein